MSPDHLSSTARPAALVTGGAVRIGRMITRTLVGMGYDIALHFHTSTEAAESLAEELDQENVSCRLFAADLSCESQMLALVAKVKEVYPHLSLLVNSASIFEMGSLVETEAEFFDRHFSLNFKAPYFLARDFARCISQGQIINILDQRINSNRGDYFTYSLTKKALADLTRMAAVELGPEIRVNAIAPGFILPPTDPQRCDTKRPLENIPLKKQGTDDTICRSVKYLIENDYVTGQILFTDGGEHLA